MPLPAESLCQIRVDCYDPGNVLIQMKDSRGGRGGGEDILLMTEMALLTTQSGQAHKIKFRVIMFEDLYPLTLQLLMN